MNKLRSARIIFAALLAGFLALGGAASTRRAKQETKTEPQAATQPQANPNDVESVDSILAALYDVISGPPGERDWNRFRSLFIPEGRLTAVRVSKEGKISYAMMSVEDYATHAGAYFKEHAFYESEVSRKTEQFGQMAHVYSTYASRDAKGAAPFQRGVNSIELFNDGKRWWCVSIYWDAEREGNPIPKRFLPK